MRRPRKGRVIGLGGSVDAEHGPVAPFQVPWGSWSGGGQCQQSQGGGETGHFRAQGLQLCPLCWTQRSFLEYLQLSWKGSSPAPDLPSGSHTTGTLLEEGTCSRGNKGISVPSPSASQEWLGQGDRNLFSPGIIRAFSTNLVSNGRAKTGLGKILPFLHKLKPTHRSYCLVPQSRSMG